MVASDWIRNVGHEDREVELHRRVDPADRGIDLVPIAQRARAQDVEGELVREQTLAP